MARTLRSDKMLFWATLTLLGVSLIMVYSASALQLMNAGQSGVKTLLRQTMFVALGLALLLVAMRLDYRLYRQPALIWALLGLTLVGLIAAFFSAPRGNTLRWISVWGFTAQPSELAKLAAVVFTAALLERRMHRVNEVNYALLPIVIVAAVFAGLILLQPDFGTAVILVVVVGTMVFAAGLSYRHLGVAALILVPLAIALIFAADYRERRLMSFLHWDDPTGAGFQLRQSLIAVGSGGVFGKGFMAGLQKLYYVPEPDTDFIYAVIGEELGLMGTTTILACFGLIAWRGLRAALLASDRFGALLGIGLTSMIAIQALVNISVSLGLLPTKGIPLPFVSHGGSSLVVNLVAMGILLNISQQSPPAVAINAASHEPAHA